MTALVTGDLHIGSRHFRREAFERFLDGLPPGADLILNGDVIDRRRRRLTAAERATLARLAAESHRRTVVWVAGNHDPDYRPADPGAIRFVPAYAIGRRLFIQHGFYFDRVMPYHRLFILLFRIAHWVRLRLGAEPVHVAQYAKKWDTLYRVLRNNVRRNAVRFAQANGYAAVACGHTHYPEDVMVDGVRYFNTGAWTETPAYVLRVDDEGLELQPFA